MLSFVQGAVASFRVKRCRGVATQKNSTPTQNAVSEDPSAVTCHDHAMKGSLDMDRIG